MGKYLDIDDVVEGNPQAKEELVELRNQVARYREALRTIAKSSVHALEAEHESK